MAILALYLQICDSCYYQVQRIVTHGPLVLLLSFQEKSDLAFHVNCLLGSRKLTISNIPTAAEAIHFFGTIMMFYFYIHCCGHQMHIDMLPFSSRMSAMFDSYSKSVKNNNKNRLNCKFWHINKHHILVETTDSVHCLCVFGSCLMRVIKRTCSSRTWHVFFFLSAKDWI